MNMITINLLPPEMRRSGGGVRMSRAAIVGTVVVVAFVGIFAGLTFYQTMRLAAVTEDIGRAQAKVDQLRDDIALVDRLEDVKTKILRRMSAIEALDRDRGFWVNNVEDLLAVIPDYLWLSGFEKQTMSNAAGMHDVDTTHTATRYHLNGYCFTISSLANLIMNLQDSPRFSHVVLHRAILQELENRRVYEFQVACELEPISPDDSGFGDEAEEATELSVYDLGVDQAMAADRDDAETGLFKDDDQ